MEFGQTVNLVSMIMLGSIPSIPTIPMLVVKPYFGRWVIRHSKRDDLILAICPTVENAILVAGDLAKTYNCKIQVNTRTRTFTI